MIRCRECGTVNDESAGFCGGCGQFLEWTGEHHLRHTKFVGLREDKAARDVRRE